MDGHRFDGMAKSLAMGVTRRGMLKALGAGVGALAFGVAGRGDASARRSCRADGLICRKSGIDGDCCSGLCGPKDRTGRRRCGCPAGTSPCNGSCIPSGSTCACVAPCGTCEVCVNGLCQPQANDVACGTASICCGGQCVSNESLIHCGTCAQVCAGAQICAAGDCCLQEGETCAFTGDGECCTGVCQQSIGICGYIVTGQLCSQGHPEQCSSGTCNPYDVGYFCDPNGAGGTCRVLGDCISGLCQGGICACSPAGGSCAIAGDCCDRPCFNGVCQFIPTGQFCLNGFPEQCSSGTCNPFDVLGYVCEPNGAGGFCRVTADCATGLLCVAGVCA